MNLLWHALFDREEATIVGNRADTVARRSWPLMAEDAADGVPDGGGSRVLEVVANIGDPSPREALDAWLENVWTDGEGLPAFSVPLRRDRDGLVTDRLLAPSVVCERLLQVDRLSCSVVYEVSNPGLLTCATSHNSKPCRHAARSPTAKCLLVCTSRHMQTR